MPTLHGFEICNVLQSCIPGWSTERRPKVVLTTWFVGLFWSFLLEPIPEKSRLRGTGPNIMVDNCTPVLCVLFYGSFVETKLITDTGLERSEKSS